MSQSHSKKAHNLETEILSHSGLELGKELLIKDVEIEYAGPGSYIHTTICGQENKDKPLVLLHGYGGSGILYYPMLKDLSKAYNVYCLDMLGMGLSSRPKAEFETTEETIKFFVESTEAWRKSMGLEKLYIGGHSFGGYMACQYALKYPERVKKLFLLSPVGLSYSNEEVNIEEMKKKMGFIRRKLFGLVQSAWQDKMTPQAMMKKHSWVGPWGLKRYVNNRFQIPKEVKKPLYDFLMETFKLPEGSEKALYYILKPPRARAILPLENLIKDNLKAETVVYYGDKDWMDQTGARRIDASGALKHFKLKTIQNSGHQITVENPDAMTAALIAEL